MSKFLTKSLFTQGVYCPELLWFAAHAKDELSPITADQQAMFDQGTQVGTLATTRYPDGIRVDAEGFAAYVEASKQALSQEVPVFEAALIAGRQYCRVDILRPTPRGWDILEVKSGTSVKEVNLWDVAFQVDTARRAGLVVHRAYILHINSSYVRGVDLDVQELFTEVDVTEDIEPFLSRMSGTVSSLLRVLDGPRPQLPATHSCSSPYGCPLRELIVLPEHNVTELYRSTGKDFLDKGVLRIADIVDGAGLSHKQFVQWRAVTLQAPQVDHQRLSEWLGSLQEPVSYLDFETINPAIPLFENTSPYQHIPFQFSLEVDQTDGTVSHYEYLHPDGSDPRPALLHALQVMRGEGSVLAHNASFERRVLSELLSAFPGETWLSDVMDRLVDTITPFREFWYYHPKQHGSCSLKAILPALTGAFYSDLEISSGSTASQEFLRITQKAAPDAEHVRSQLLEYCKQDTQGLREVVEVLKQRVLKPE